MILSKIKVNEALLKTTQEEKKNIEEDIKKDRNLIEKFLFIILNRI